MFVVIFMAVAILTGGFAAVLICNEWMLRREKTQKQAKKLKRLAPEGVRPQPKNELAKVFEKLSMGDWRERKEKERLQASYERDLPACLEVVALGMQAGMGFDQAFELYTERFNTLLAKRCHDLLMVWKRGLISREAGMKQLSDRIATPSFAHFSSSVLKALRFGAPLTPLLMNLAKEARKEYRAKRQEMVAKAPVKMLLPTGVLILPAMLLLVMGPVMLDLLRNMG